MNRMHLSLFIWGNVGGEIIGGDYFKNNQAFLCFGGMCNGKYYSNHCIHYE